MSRRRRWPLRGAASLLAAALALAAGPATAAERPWGLGWDEGLTLRRWLGDGWELSVAAGPDDYLDQAESRAWNQADAPQLQGMVQVPLDEREEHGWVRLQVGRRLARDRTLGLVGFCGLTHEWIDRQERTLLLDPLVGDYDSWELDRFTGRWILAAGLRPSWRPAPALSVELAVGLRYYWESWHQDTRVTRAGVAGADLEHTDGTRTGFGDFGWEGAASLQFFFWF